MKYEYKTIVLEIPRKPGLWSQKPQTDGLKHIDQTLAQLGEEGWNLVGVFPVTDGSNPAQISCALHYFSRPKA
ncbi:hypothetical protein Rhal01_03805 [Rubritalea halochordaticola]|uniref:DUF4177 domain-containing protein n=1 Tax=Rubritalea halochordaticola TaxID=714537 RepID=A0ABP9V4L2_9BACT